LVANLLFTHVFPLGYRHFKRLYVMIFQTAMNAIFY